MTGTSGRVAWPSPHSRAARCVSSGSHRAGALVSQVVVPELNGTYGRLRTPMLGPNGALYLTTSNGSGSDKILKVVPGRPPAFAGATDTREVAENNSTSAVVATVTATDPDGERLTYTLGGRDARFFAIANPAAGGLRANVRFDHEAQSSYEVVVTATDPYGLSDSVTLTITVTDVDEAPEVGGEAHVTIEENSTEYVGHYSATDPEGVSPSWTALSGPDRSHFKVDAAGDLSFTTVPDYDARADANRDNRYEVTVGASDGTLTGTLNVTVTVTNVNEPPKVTGDEAVDFAEGGTGNVATYTASDPENATLVWQALEGTDAGDFTFSNGVLRFDSHTRFRVAHGCRRRQWVPGAGAGLRRSERRRAGCDRQRHQRGRGRRAHLLLGTAGNRLGADGDADGPGQRGWRVLDMGAFAEPEHLGGDRLPAGQRLHSGG